MELAFEESSPSSTSAMSNASTISSSTRTSATVQYTPSPTPANLDPDNPLQSIERDAPSTSVASESNPGSPIYTPSVSSDGAALRQGSEHPSLDRRFHDLRLGSVTPQRLNSSPTSSTPQREVSNTSPTPSIRVTPTPPIANSRHSTVSRRIEGLADGIGALDMGSLSPSPSRRRRSSTGVNRSPHRVEDEEPPESLFYERRVQEALNNARNITGRVARVLSESNMHQEQGSSVQTIYQQAARLNTFEPSSCRKVGLVGESGVGKSSLINSLLDKMEFARAVSPPESSLVATN
jgi:ABC-type multidrug transport system fused ATPase/permease subunit